MIATILLTLSYIVFWVACVMSKKKYYLMASATSSALSLVWLIVTKQYDGTAYRVLGLARDALAIKKYGKYKHVVTSLLAIAMAVSIGFAWNGWSSVFILIVAWMGIVISFYVKIEMVRLLSIIRSVAYCIYLLCYGQYLGIVLESINIVCFSVALIYYKRKEKSK